MKTFCPDCEKETECSLYSEVYECNECKEDFEVPINASEGKIKKLETRLTDCESALISMINQYLSRRFGLIGQGSSDEIYMHDFMSAGEEACWYLTEYGLAEWTDEYKYAIRFIQKKDSN